jgi:uncharacterized membrane protein (UPF0136 family)
LLAFSGLVGFVKDGSLLSLLAGSITAVIAVIALQLSITHNRSGVPLGILLSFVVFLVCSFRDRREKRKVRLRDHEGEPLAKANRNELLLYASGLVLGVLSTVQSQGLRTRALIVAVFFAVLIVIFVVRCTRS